MKNFFLKHPVKVLLLIAFLIPAAVIVFRSALNYSGYCIPERRYMTDEEFIRSAVRTVNNYKKTFLPGKDGKWEEARNINYESVDAFLAANKNCCRIVGPEGKGDDMPGRFEQRIWGSHAKYVLVDYVQRYEDKKGKKGTKIEFDRFKMTNCGNARH